MTMFQLEILPDKMRLPLLLEASYNDLKPESLLPSL